MNQQLSIALNQYSQRKIIRFFGEGPFDFRFKTYGIVHWITLLSTGGADSAQVVFDPPKGSQPDPGGTVTLDTTEFGVTDQFITHRQEFDIVAKHINIGSSDNLLNLTWTVCYTELGVSFNPLKV